MSVFISAEATKGLLNWRQLVDRLRAVYSIPHHEHANPPRLIARGENVWLRGLVAVPPGCRFMGAKVFGLSRSRTCNYVVILIDQQTGEIVAFVDGHLLTAYRTGATSAAAVDRLSSQGSHVLGVLGSGVEARAHVRAIASIRQISSLKIFSPAVANRESFAAEFAVELGIDCRATPTPEQAVAGSTIVVAAARSKTEAPVLEGKWLERGMLIVSIGSTLPEQREIDVDVIKRCDLLVFDAVTEVVQETGDMLAAKAAGVPFDYKTRSLNEVLCAPGGIPALEDKITMFKSAGAAIQDIVVAELAFELATAQGRATPLPVEFLTKYS